MWLWKILSNAVQADIEESGGGKYYDSSTFGPCISEICMEDSLIHRARNVFL